MISSSANQMEHSQGRSLILCSRARGRICLKRCSNVEGSFNFLAILFPVRPLNQEDFPNVHSVIENLVSGKEIANLLLAGRLKHFISNWQRIITELVILHFARHCVKSVRIRSYSGPYFPAFGLNKARYGVSLRVQSEYGKKRTRITPNTNTFHSVGG